MSPTTPDLSSFRNYKIPSFPLLGIEPGTSYQFRARCQLRQGILELSASASVSLTIKLSRRPVHLYSVHLPSRGAADATRTPRGPRARRPPGTSPGTADKQRTVTTQHQPAYTLHTQAVTAGGFLAESLRFKLQGRLSTK